VATPFLVKGTVHLQFPRHHLELDLGCRFATACGCDFLADRQIPLQRPAIAGQVSVALDALQKQCRVTEIPQR
jgi:hypothetical protein